MKNVYIVAAVRTAVGKMGGTLINMPADELLSVSIKEAITRAGIQPGQLDEVIVGQAKQSADAANIARVSALLSGIPVEVPAYTVMRQCGSGMQAIQNGLQEIQCEEADVVLVGGVESMSTAPYYLRGARYGYKAGNAELVDPNTESQPCSQPQSIYGRFNMGMTAENLAERYNISREEQDVFALQSQERAADAIASGRFKEEIVPIVIPQKKGDPIVFDTDEHPRSTSLEKLAKLKPAFKDGGTVTAGNCSGRNDGSSALILADEEKIAEYGLKPMAKILACTAAGVDPTVMGLGPVESSKKALKRAGLKLEDIGLIELNEAFAAQSLAVIKELGLDQSILNVNGGAIALGHPLGSSGSRITITLLYEMIRRKTRYGLATLCTAGGQGMSTILELC